MRSRSKSSHLTRTTLDFDRGLFDERYRSPVYQTKPRPKATPTKADTAPPPPPPVCADGLPTTFPREMTLELSKVPAWLETWAHQRGFRRGDFQKAALRPNLLVTAAVAYVLEMYWRQSIDHAQVNALSVLRATDLSPNHRVGAAVDVAIITAPRAPKGEARTVGVLQTWAAFHRLSEAGRIPPGGCGLYLNLGPGGITGTTPDQAGQASRPRRKTGPPSLKYPAGGSAGVHYDYRGTFGFRTDEAPSTWIAADTDGDGHDELTLSASDRTILTEFLPQHAPALLAYFNRRGANDSTLAEVGPTVPNLMQVLGQVPSCFLRGPQ